MCQIFLRGVLILADKVLEQEPIKRAHAEPSPAESTGLFLLTHRKPLEASTLPTLPQPSQAAAVFGHLEKGIRCRALSCLKSRGYKSSWQLQEVSDLVEYGAMRGRSHRFPEAFSMEIHSPSLFSHKAPSYMVEKGTLGYRQ